MVHQQNQNQNIHQKVSQNVIYPKNQYQNICDQAPQQSRVHQQNQYQNIYPNQLIYPQQPIQQNNIISNQFISNNQMTKVPISNINKLQLDQKEVLLDKRAGIWSKKEIDELYSYESAICKIKIQYIENGQIKEGLGTGCFCEISDNFIPFKKALFTNNHILDKNKLEIGRVIMFEICNQLYKIKITNNRKVFTNEILDYTCIEIFNSDYIPTFFQIDNNIFKNKNSLISKEIFILQYPLGELSHALGTILNFEDNRICHNVNTDKGSSCSI